jgi:MoxR-like ATPase
MLFALRGQESESKSRFMEIQKWLSESEIELFQKAPEILGSQLRGQQSLIELCLAALLARGHILLEGPVGVGKTDLAKAVSALCQCPLSRIQMTADLLPSEISGGLRPDADGVLRFFPGPIFANFVLADELNRTSPKTQAALLEAMAESQVSVEGSTRPLPQPFAVIATQNPMDSEGVFPLAESQLDRFMVYARVGAPSEQEEYKIYQQVQDPEIRTDLKWDLEFLQKLQGIVEQVLVHDDLLKWVTRILRKSRELAGVRQGVYVRGGLQWLALARASALLASRSFVTPADLIKVAPAALTHRIILDRSDRDRAELVVQLLNEIEAPR